MKAGNMIRGICLLTENVPVLARFYSVLLDVPFEGDETHAALKIGGIHLTFFSWEGMEQMAPGSMQGTGHGGFTLDIEVPDVDAAYGRILATGAQIVKPPQSYSWGTRSVWFRDPDGNIVNFFQRLS